jgi:hypothetical protein
VSQSVDRQEDEKSERAIKREVSGDAKYEILPCQAAHSTGVYTGKLTAMSGGASSFSCRGALSDMFICGSRALRTY